MKYEVFWTEGGKQKSEERQSYKAAEILARFKDDAVIKPSRSNNVQPVA